MGQKINLSRTALLSFLTVYIIWGSTYLAIRYAVEGIPAWAMTSARYLIAAAFMYLIALFKNEAALKKAERRVSIQSGALLVTANAVVCVVEYWVPSGIVAVVVGAMPIWIMLLGWLSFNQAKPTLPRLIGAVIGLSGVALIATSRATPAADNFARYGVLILGVSSLMWATGTLLQRQVPNVVSVFRFSGLQFLAGGIVTGVVSLVAEHPWQIQWAAVNRSAWFAFFYLIFFGSILAFTAFSWLSRNVETRLVSTYALVNPVIAVVLGWFCFDEPVGASFIFAVALVIMGLTLLMLRLPEKSVRARH